MAVRRIMTVSPKEEKPRLMDSGKFDLTIGWVRKLDSEEGFACRFDTDDGQVFFKTFYTADGYSWENKMLIGCIVTAAGIPFPVEAEDLRGARFRAEVEVRPSEKPEHPFYNFLRVGRCEA